LLIAADAAQSAVALGFRELEDDRAGAP